MTMQRKSKDTKPKNRKGNASNDGSSKGVTKAKSSPVQKHTGAPKKAWGKDAGKQKQDDIPSAARGALKPVKVKLDEQGRDTILDILHQLHIAGMDDGIRGANEADGDQPSVEDNGEQRLEGEETVDEEDSEDGDMEGAIYAESTEFGGSFAEMANLLSGMVVNEESLPRDGNGIFSSDIGTVGARLDTKHVSHASGTTGRKAANSPENSSGADDLGGSSKALLPKKLTREKLLAVMVAEDRKLAEEERAKSGVRTEKMKTAAAGVGRERASATDGVMSEKVRLELCMEHRKTGAPDLNTKKACGTLQYELCQGHTSIVTPPVINDRCYPCVSRSITVAAASATNQIVVCERSEPLERFMGTCKAKLHMRKKPKGAALVEGDEVVEWLSDLTRVPNGAVVLISTTVAAPTRKDKSSSDARSRVPVSVGDADGGEQGNNPKSGPVKEETLDEGSASRGTGGPGKVKDIEDEDEEETLALAALERIRRSYEKRATERARQAIDEGRSQAEASKRMSERKCAVEQTERFRRMMAQRQNLPAYARREDIGSIIRDNQVVVLSGETGCGKTTQVPQFVLDGLIEEGRGGYCNIVCTQPRRISAVSVAERVAAERCETIGDTVGYQIRLESRVGQSTRLTFCTTGILLRRLTSDDTLAGVSHVIVDEVHERDLQTDFLLVILRDLLPKRPDLHVVLMSATLQTHLFAKYFGDCATITIPGRTFPVEVHFMDHINRVVRASKTSALMPRVSGATVASAAAGDRRSAAGGSRGPGARGGGSMTRGASGGRSRGGQDRISNEEEDLAIEFDPLTGEPLDPMNLEGGNPNGKGKAGAARRDAAAMSMVSPKCEDRLDYDIIVELVEHIVDTEEREARKGSSTAGGGRGQGRRGGRGQAGRGGKASGTEEGGEPLGAILVFLPGFAEIDQLVRALERHPRIRRACRVFPLHSTLPSHQQKAIFQRMPPDVRKIVVSTNIAETSVTIDDCTHVIDAGRVREMRYDPVTRMSCLMEVWISKASANQRAGRAGRVRPGKCWRLYPEAFHEMYMPSYTLAEMLRTPLEELVLQVLLLELGSPAEFLHKAIEPPPPKMIRAALRNLHDLQAIIIMRNTLRPILTPLGYHLARLPMDARVGKLLVVGAVLQCLDPVLTIAAALSHKPPFQRPFGEQGKADAARQRFAQYKSDHLAIVEAFGAWRNKRRNSSHSELWRWCSENFLSLPTLEMLHKLREQFRQQLAEVGFVTAAIPSQRASGRDALARGEPFSKTVASSGGNDGGPGLPDSDRNSGNIALVQSALCAGLYPNVAAFVRPDPRRELKKGHFVTRDDPEPVFLHPSSVNHGRFAGAAATGRQVWVMYHSKIKTKQVYIHDATYATPFSLMLWGGHIRHDRSAGRSRKEGIDVIIDGWLRFRMSEKTAVAFKAMRRELNNLLVSKIEDPFADHVPLAGTLVAHLGRLLDIEGRSE